MKKNTSFITVDSALVRWIRDKINIEQPNSVYSKELLQGLNDLIQSEDSTLILSMTNNSKSFIDNIDDNIYAGDLSIYLKSRKVLRKDLEISLTPKEFDILYFLAQNRGYVYTKEQIFQAVWEEDYLMSDSNIMAFIRKLRKKIEPNPDEPEYIITIWGIGYKFNDQY
ncbi:winged helix-turn-helix domain-containing protein [Lachnoclostridium phytofermentans]|uniref:Putative two component transcriptional regulator, winged helix family n=1 Tax=Lachnoclostridium phytofermentans (strain ATCC 700394 / DSM 18823 / ISDg) TaxID=357809 RepID=A9KI97_LACP7|nr:winged helix-turn-helix domain-containing protein [Lachnoclostridium phytofermentans]ABX40931.1 putative two component transcriptional regulator, winged helix family [Lachnoclostridium phytofermentans ISDg]